MTSSNNALTLRHGSKDREHACLGLPDAFALERGQGNHIPSPGVTTAKEKGSEGPVQGRRECGTVKRNTTHMTARPARII